MSQALHRIPITVAEPGGVHRSAWPMTLGIPFAEGALGRDIPVRLVDESGRSLPLQTKCLATWRPDRRDVKWLLADWQMDLRAGETQTVYLEHGPDIEPAAHDTPIHIEEEDQALRISTGPLFAVFSRRNGDFFKSCRVWNGNGWVETLRSRPGLHAYMTDQHGVSYDTWQAAPKPDLSIEERGPLRTVICVKGYHADEQGRRFCPYILRLHFYAGRSYIRCFHTFVFDQDAERIELQSIGLRMPLDIGASCEMLYGGEAAHHAAGTSRSTFIQKNDLSYNIYQQQKQIASGPHTNGWAALRGEKASVVAVIRDMWREYPKGFALSGSEMDVQIRPDAGDTLKFHTPFKEEAIRFGGTRDEATFKRLIDQRPNAPLNLKSLAATTPEEIRWAEEMVARHAPDRPASYNDTGTGNGMGAAKTTEILLHFSPGAVDADEAESLAIHVQAPVIPFTDPAYACDTDAMRLSAPHDPDRFTEAEAGLTHLFTAIVAEPRRILRTYGMIDYGDLMCSHSGTPAVLWQMYKDHPNVIEKMQYCARSYNNEANDQVHALWGFYTRTGNRDCYLAAEAYGRHMADVDIIHAHTSPERVGLMHYHNCHHWTGGPSPSHTCIAGLMRQYYLTGDRRIFDVCLEVADWAVSQQEPAGIFSNRRGALVREFTTPLANLLEVYQATWAHRYGDLARRSLTWLMKAMPEPGCFPMSIYTAGEHGDDAIVEQNGWHLRQAGGMTPELLYDAAYLWPDDGLFKEALVNLADRYMYYKNDIFEVLAVEEDTLEQLDPYFNAAVIAYAYHATENPIYAAYCRFYLSAHFPGRARHFSFTYVCWGSIIPPMMEAVRRAEAKYGDEALERLENDWIERLRANIDEPCPSATSRPEKRSLGRKDLIPALT